MCVKMIEDYNVPRAIKHLITESSKLAKQKYLFAPPVKNRKMVCRKMSKVNQFADENGVFCSKPGQHLVWMH